MIIKESRGSFVIASSDLSERGNLMLRLLRRIAPRNDKYKNLQLTT